MAVTKGKTSSKGKVEKTETKAKATKAKTKAKVENKGVSRYAKDGECWLTIRIPLDIKEVISAIAANSDRSESYVARCLVLSRLNQLLNRHTEDFTDRLAVPDVFIEPEDPAAQY